ncbi:uncharacterized protein VTP21DRAFT_10472 [Calcarisporiella thermophila]|uniref:uncharacterized protein n=1 Tax=Calcarisporiella thermophila TaxID=911321 RepID=UPI003742ACB4
MKQRNASIQASRLFWSIVFPRLPLLVSTALLHALSGPPSPGLDLRFHICLKLARDFISNCKSMTVEATQSHTIHPLPGPLNYTTAPISIPASYRAQAVPYLEKLLRGHENIIEWDWKDEHWQNSCDPLSGEWIYRKHQPMAPSSERDISHTADPTSSNSNTKFSLNASFSRKLFSTGTQSGMSLQRVVYYLHGGAYYLGSTYTHRRLMGKIAKRSAARVFAINYRLAPQHPFPAALHDALAGYLYLISPPEDLGLKPIDPKNILIMGDSAGGGLTFALLLTLRDSGLPLPAGAACMSPWVDLSHSFPSIMENASTDYVPSNGFVHLMSPAQDYTQLPKPASTSEVPNDTLNGNLHTKTEQLRKLRRLHFYAPNTALQFPLVSPVYATDLGGLPPLLIQVGNGEMLRDEGRFIAHKASSKLGEREATSVTLQVFDGMPHVFQLFTFLPTSRIAFTQLGEFVQRVTAPHPRIPPETIKRMRVNMRGEIKEETEPPVDVRSWEKRFLEQDMLHRLKEFFVHDHIII